jgi:hypothetical protein
LRLWHKLRKVKHRLRASVAAAAARVAVMVRVLREVRAAVAMHAARKLVARPRRRLRK